MTTHATLADPELSAEERVELALAGARPRRAFVSREAKYRFERGAVIPPSVPLRIWEALEAGWWECKGCGAHVTNQAEEPAVCEACLEKRSAGRWVWHEAALAGGMR